jgi:hypothetical protein
MGSVEEIVKEDTCLFIFGVVVGVVVSVPCYTGVHVSDDDL